MSHQKIIVAITGASGSVYAQRFLGLMHQKNPEIKVSVIFSNSGKQVSQFELGQDIDTFDYSVFDNSNLFAPPASGSAGYHSMIIIPCSMGTLGRIANGVSGDLISRAADVMLKERKKLVLVARETPLSLIHLNNMTSITAAGGIILPACPSFYSLPENMNELIDTVIYKCIDLLGIQNEYSRWGDEARK